MTDRIKALVITLDDDYRDDDVEVIISAISMIKGVQNVDKSVTTLNDHVNRQRVKHEITSKILKAIKEYDG